MTRSGFLVALTSLIAATASLAATIGSRFDPNDYASNGALSLVSGDTITFDTTAMTYSGTFDAGGTFSGSGVAANSESQLAGVGGNTSAADGVFVQLAMYNFDSINIGSSVTIVVDGNAGIALGSLGDMTIGSNIAVNGGNGGQSAIGQGGSGGESGVAKTSFNSDPPNNNNGDGGRHGGGNDLAANGRGYGGGIAPTTANNNGGGAGYGGRGGGDSNSQRGQTYGDEQLTLLFGGSGGAGSNGNTNANDSSGAGGGGAIELTAVGTLTLTGNLNANGGRGNMTSATGNDKGSGSGSGGGILLNADDIVITGLVNANGGNGRNGQADAPGGGGGRIAIYAGNSLTLDGENIEDGALITDANVDPTFSVDGGDKGDIASGDGTLYISVVPEPATMSLLVLGGVALTVRRRRRGA